MLAKDWSDHVKSWVVTVEHDTKIPSGHSIRTHLAATITAANKTIVDALANFDKAEADFAKVVDLAGREKLHKDMEAAESSFTSHFNALATDFRNKLNPAGKSFIPAFMNHGEDLHKQWAKIVGHMHEVEGTAFKAITTLKAGAPERPKTAAPGH